MVNLIVVDSQGIPLRDVNLDDVGRRDLPVPALAGGRMVQALPPGFSGLARRYSSHPPGESSVFAMDFSMVVQRGVTIVTGGVLVMLNTFVVAPVPSPDWMVGAVGIDGRAVNARLTGGVEGTDYQVRWTVTDSDGNTFVRTALVLCAQTS